MDNNNESKTLAAIDAAWVETLREVPSLKDLLTIASAADSRLMMSVFKMGFAKGANYATDEISEQMGAMVDRLF